MLLTVIKYDVKVEKTLENVELVKVNIKDIESNTVLCWGMGNITDLFQVRKCKVITPLTKTEADESITLTSCDKFGTPTNDAQVTMNYVRNYNYRHDDKAGRVVNTRIHLSSLDIELVHLTKYVRAFTKLMETNRERYCEVVQLGTEEYALKSEMDKLKLQADQKALRDKAKALFNAKK